MRYWIYAILLGFALLGSTWVHAHDSVTLPADTINTFDDSTQWKPRPAISALLSTAIPGAGQFYNRRYWKIPLIYGTFGTLYYFADLNNKYYNEYLLRYASYGLPGPTVFYDDDVPDYILERYKDYYHRNRDFVYIFIGLTYVLNIVDALVDAHLYNYDAGEDFDFSVAPVMMPTNQFGVNNPAFGVHFRLTLK